VSATVGLAGVAITGGFSRHEPLGVACIAAVAGFALIGQVCMTRAFAGPATMLAANLQYTNIGFAAVIGTLVFEDALTVREAAGLAVIAASGAAATWVAARGSRRVETANAATAAAAAMVATTTTGAPPTTVRPRPADAPPTTSEPIR
jgi:hypothetical protein